jgi:cysteine desulfurase/selenocysteine lyase
LADCIIIKPNINRKINMVYADAAASALKSKNVISSEIDFLSNKYANSGRGVCERASNVDKMISSARDTISRFIGSSASDKVIFTSGTTDGMNRIAKILETSEIFNKKTKPVVMVSDLDHHSARMPFEYLANTGKCKIKIAELDNKFNIIPEKCDVFVITAMSNVLGNKQNVKKLIALAHEKNPNVITVVDAAQYVAHYPIDVKSWNCDFLCFSGHKIGSDTGVGVMYIKEPSRWNPDKFGGGMISSIVGDKWNIQPAPSKFEAGTLPLTQIIGLGVATKELTVPNVKVQDLTSKLRKDLSSNPRIKFISPENSELITFVIDDMDHLDFGIMAGAYGVCLRVGHCCASWLHKKLGINGSIRISLGPWNTNKDVQEISKIINKIIK